MNEPMHTITPEMIQRINELAHKAKQGPLTVSEADERAKLRAEYLAAIREQFRQQLDSITVEEADGSRHKLRPKDSN